MFVLFVLERLDFVKAIRAWRADIGRLFYIVLTLPYSTAVGIFSDMNGV